jgi:hypothetical protein
MPTASNAVENGKPIPGDKRVLPVYTDFNKNPDYPFYVQTCSAYLLTDRIVVTAQHCTIDGQSKQPKDPADFIVGQPGEQTSSEKSPSKFRAVKIFREPDFRWYDIKTDLSYQNDIAVVVFAKPVAKVNPAVTLSKEEMLKLRDVKQDVFLGGYGLQSIEDRTKAEGSPSSRKVFPAQAPGKLISEDEHFSAIAANLSRVGRSYYDARLWGVQFDSLQAGTPCDRDSGSGFYTQIGDKTVYLGPSNGLISIPNCQTQGMPMVTQPIAGFYPTYVFQNLIDDALEYVKNNPVKSTVVCVKGKSTKKVTGVNPKCPKGFKKK